MPFFKTKIFYGILIIWITLWAVFLFQENKPGDKAALKFMYEHPNHDQKIKYLLGNDFYNFLIFSQKTLPAKASYRIFGIKTDDLEDTQARYFLWPLIKDVDNPQYELYFKSLYGPKAGYKLFKRLDNMSYILVRENIK